MLSSFAYAHGGTESGKKQRKDRNRERHFTVLQRKSLFHGTYATTKLMYMAGALEFLSWKRQTDSATFSHSPNRIPRDFPLVLSHLTRECPCPSVPQREIAAFGTVRRSRERKQFNLGLNSSKSLICKLANKLGFSRLPAEKGQPFSGGSIPLRDRSASGRLFATLFPRLCCAFHAGYMPRK